MTIEEILKMVSPGSNPDDFLSLLTQGDDAPVDPMMGGNTSMSGSRPVSWQTVSATANPQTAPSVPGGGYDIFNAPQSAISQVGTAAPQYFGPGATQGQALTEPQQDWFGYSQTNQLPQRGPGFQAGKPIQGNDGQWYALDANGNVQPFTGTPPAGGNPPPPAPTNGFGPDLGALSSLFSSAFPSTPTAPAVQPSAGPAVPQTATTTPTAQPTVPASGGGVTVSTSAPGGGQFGVPPTSSPNLGGQVTATPTPTSGPNPAGGGGTTSSGTTGGTVTGGTTPTSTTATNPTLQGALGTVPMPSSFFPTANVPLGPTSSGGANGGGFSYDPDTGVPLIGGITLPDTPLESTTYDPAVQDFFRQLVSDQAGDIGSYYEQGAFPNMQAAQLDLSTIPQVQASQIGASDSLNQLLSGQGFGDDIMSLLRGQATDSISRSGASQRSSDRLTAQRAGLDQSGAGVALENQTNRRVNDAVANAQNQLSIENADRGLENFRLGAGMDQNRLGTNAQLANQTALQNAANLFTGMQTNVANVQQASGMNTANQQQREMTRAGAQATNTGNLGQMFGSATLNRADTVGQMNTGNRINRDLNQAQLQRQGDIYNTGSLNNAYSQALNAYMSMVNGAGSGAQNYNLGGATAAGNYTPNFGYANMLQNIGSTLNQPRTP